MTSLHRNNKEGCHPRERGDPDLINYEVWIPLMDIGGMTERNVEITKNTI